MKKNLIAKHSGKLSSIAILSFLVSLMLCSFLLTVTIRNRSNVERLQMEHLILEKTFRINEVISRLLYKTNSIATMVIQTRGIENDIAEIFDIVAPSIIDDPAIINILVAPDGIVTNVYPIENNEAVIGLDFFSEGAGNREAMAARDSGTLVLGGPFNLVQGGLALVGRMPVYIDTETERHKFWGLVSVTLRFPDALDAAELSILRTQGFAYELWRINPDTNERQVIASCHEHAGSNVRYIEKHVPVINADWYLKVWPIRKWYSYPENLALIISGFLISFLIFFVMQNNYELKQMRFILEEMTRADSN
jgi:CHASE1-domain containing sensor protein